MITSSVLNAITFKNLSAGTWPNKWNTLHENRKQGGFQILPYCQLFNKDDVVYLQFESDSATLPQIELRNNQFTETINGTLVSSYSGDLTRYFYNFEITLGANYYDKVTILYLTQDTTTLTSEPIFCEDLTNYINDGTIKRIKYTNLDRNAADLSSYWVDWSVLDYMYFYVRSVDVNSNDLEETETLEGAQSKSIISSSNYSGIILQGSPVPEYMILKLKACSSLDYFEVNEIQYIKEDEVEPEQYGNTTSFQFTVNLTEKNTVGLNVDDLGITYIDQEETPMAIIAKRNTGVTSAGWQVSNPSGYMLHSVFIKHALSSAGDASVNLGITVSGSELIDSVQGNIPLADFSSVWKSFSQHYLKNPDAATTLYFSVVGAGAVLDIICNFDTVTEQ